LKGIKWTSVNSHSNQGLRKWTKAINEQKTLSGKTLHMTLASTSSSLVVALYHLDCLSPDWNVLTVSLVVWGTMSYSVQTLQLSVSGLTLSYLCTVALAQCPRNSVKLLPWTSILLQRMKRSIKYGSCCETLRTELISVKLPEETE
jgi:hypothetical protein